MSVENKIAFVSGGTRGIGFNVSQRLIASGYFCYITGRNDQDGAAAQRELGENCRFLSCDVADEASVNEVFSIIRQEKGRLDYAVNNAGITTQRSEIINLDYAEWKRVLEINLLGTLLCMSHEMKLMAATGGSIVNVSSCAGLLGTAQQSVYSTSKAAVNMLTQVAAIECAESKTGQQQIRVNAVCPGPTMGGMNSEERLKANPESTRHKLQVTAMKRFAQADEISAAICWLLSDAASYITGTVLPVDGGYSAGKF